EADVAQLDVNTRFTLFFPEKRPFFLEGIDFFSTPLDAVFTRTVADPSFGVKLSGKEGKNNVGLFVTRDEINNLIFPSNQFSSPGSINQDVFGSVLRYRRDIGAASTLGFLYSGREAEQYHNRQIGFDGFHRFSASDSLIYQFLHSDTDYPDSVAVDNAQPLDAFGGEAYFLRYNHFARTWSWWARYQDRSPEFRADSGFIPRVDIRTAEGSVSRTFFSEGGWFTRFDVGGRFLRTEDHEGVLTDREIVLFATYRGPWQSLVDAGVYRNKEFFDGVTFNINRVDLFGQLRPRGSLAFDIFARIGDAVDFVNTQKGDIVLLNPIVELKLGSRVNIRLDHTYQVLDVPGGRLFTANLSQVKLLYHFNTRTFVRAILQYEQLDRTTALFSIPVEAETNQLFSQFLFSYKINPQTVLFVGYSDNHLGLENMSLTQTDRTFFMKVGYALVF
ncbi:MAG TPA: hypothetical protein VJ521_09100, partial [Acidobacteriota bacterium]|nr:hypothetical protein [Acidobacteriota bacterium]